MFMNALQQAVEIATGQVALAIKIVEWHQARGLPCKVKQQHIWKWLHSKSPMPPAEYCRAIEWATGITVYQLRPDVFGEQCECKKEAA